MEVERWSAGEGVELFLAGCRDVAAGDWPALFARMDPDRRERCLRFRREEDRKMCVLADALARRALSARSGAEEGAVRFALGPGGKPYAPDLPWAFSLSHSGGLALCAVAPFPVGADLQLVRPFSPALTRRMVRAGYGGDSHQDFARWWVRQEAAGKLSGRGLSLRPLPAGLDFCGGELDREGGHYAWCVCWEKGVPFFNSL